MKKKQQADNVKQSENKKNKQEKKICTSCEHLQQEIQALQNKNIALEEQYLRSHAEMENSRKRTQKEVILADNRARMHILKSLLSAFDRIFLAVDNTPENLKDDAWVQGVRVSFEGLLKTTDELGLMRIPTQGQQFNPDIHEAIAQSPGEKNNILQEAQAGWKLGDQVIRPAKVIVGNGEEIKAK